MPYGTHDCALEDYEKTVAVRRWWYVDRRDKAIAHTRIDTQHAPNAYKSEAKPTRNV